MVKNLKGQRERLNEVGGRRSSINQGRWMDKTLRRTKGCMPLLLGRHVFGRRQESRSAGLGNKMVEMQMKHVGK